MRRKKERSKQGQTNKQGKATQHTHMYMYMCLAYYMYIAIAQTIIKGRTIHIFMYSCIHVHVLATFKYVRHKYMYLAAGGTENLSLVESRRESSGGESRGGGKGSGSGFQRH